MLNRNIFKQNQNMSFQKYISNKIFYTGKWGHMYQLDQIFMSKKLFTGKKCKNITVLTLLKI